MAESLDLLLGEEFLTWLWFRSEESPDYFSLDEPVKIYMEQRIVVQGGEGQAKEITSVTGALSPLREARLGLATGKKVTKALIRIEKDDLFFQFVLKAEDFTISGLKTPKMEKDKDDDPDALLLEKIYLIETCMDILDAVYKKFLQIRISQQWKEEISQINNWLTRP